MTSPVCPICWMVYERSVDPTPDEIKVSYVHACPAVRQLRSQLARLDGASLEHLDGDECTCVRCQAKYLSTALGPKPQSEGPS